MTADPDDAQSAPGATPERGAAAATPETEFPELWRSSTLDTIEWMVLSAVAAAVLKALSLHLWAGIAFVPAAALLALDVVYSMRNRSIRRAWARSFPRVVRPRDVLGLDASRHRLHVRHYAGFDAVRLPPSCVVEDLASGELAAVHPPSWRTVRNATTRGLAVVDRHR